MIVLKYFNVGKTDMPMLQADIDTITCANGQQCMTLSSTLFSPIFTWSIYNTDNQLFYSEILVPVKSLGL